MVRERDGAEPALFFDANSVMSRHFHCELLCEHLAAIIHEGDSEPQASRCRMVSAMTTGLECNLWVIRFGAGL
jgi:hypothetical protein